MDTGSVSDWSARTLLLYIALRHTYGTLASTVGIVAVGTYHGTYRYGSVGIVSAFWHVVSVMLRRS